MGRSATLCRSARPHTPRGDRRCTRSWLVSAVELRLGKISASLTQDLVGLTELAVLSLQGLELGGHVRGQARLAPAVSLGPANPLMQRLRRAADLRGNRSHRRPPRGMILLVLENQPNRKRAHFRRKSVRCLACHRSTFSRLGASGKPGAVLLRKRRRVKERLHRRFAEAPSSLVRPFLIVTLDPAIEIDLEIGDRAVDLLAKGDAIELIEHGLMEPFDDAIIRYEIIGASLSGFSRKGTGDMVSPSETGRREHEGAGRPPIDSGLRARARYMAAPCDFPGCAVSADQ